MFDFNEYWFLLQALITLPVVLLCFRLGRPWVMAYIAVSIVLMNIFAMKQVNIFGLEATLGNIMYASIFLATDLLSEHYGRKEAFKAVRVGFFFAIFAGLMVQFALHYVPSEYDFAQESFATLFSLTPRIVAASLLTYLLSQNLDIWLFHAIKKRTGEKWLWLRNNASTLVAQFIDSWVFTYLAFYGVFEQLPQIALFTFFIKMAIALLDTPFLYLSKLPMFEPESVRARNTRLGRMFRWLSGEDA
jgi:uncharacterized integral membrane protein (TIGR00697 family)